jgi:hypothetical protein
MPRPRLHEDRPLTATERVQRFRSQIGHRRLDLRVDLVEHDQVERFAQHWDCSRQEVFKIAFRACLPAMKRAASPREAFDLVRDALEAAGVA